MHVVTLNDSPHPIEVIAYKYTSDIQHFPLDLYKLKEKKRTVNDEKKKKTN